MGLSRQLGKLSNLVTTNNNSFSKQGEEAEPTTCWICHRPLPENLAYTTVEAGKYCHLKCALRLKRGRKKEE